MLATEKRGRITLWAIRSFLTLHEVSKLLPVGQGWHGFCTSICSVHCKSYSAEEKGLWLLTWFAHSQEWEKSRVSCTQHFFSSAQYSFHYIWWKYITIFCVMFFKPLNLIISMQSICEAWKPAILYAYITKYYHNYIRK